MKNGLYLAGGGVKGAAHIGAIKVFEEKGIKFDYVAGTSSGSIVAALYASGFTSDEMLKIFIPLFPNPLLKIMLDFRSEIHKLMELRKNALTKHFCAFPMNPFHTISLLRSP